MRNEPAMKPFQLIALLAVVVLVGIAGVLVDPPSVPGTGAARMLVYAVAASLGSVLVAGSAGRDLSPSIALRLAATAAVALAAAAGVDPSIRPDAVAAGRLTLIVLLFTLVAIRVTARITTSLPGSSLMAVLLCATLFGLPVWLAPLAVLFPDAVMVSDLIVALCPLTAFAVALDVDYLRLPWFYEHSVIGSLRYDYPAWSVYAGSLAALTALLWLADRRRGKNPPGNEQQEPK